MIKTIARAAGITITAAGITITAALGTFIAAAPALAGPGLVLQGRSLNGIKLHDAAVAGLALYAEPQRAPLPSMPAAPPPVDAALKSAPMQTACINNCGGIKFNGTKLNGLTWNGLKWNGLTWNGLTWNGWSLNGTRLNSVKLNGGLSNGTAAGAVAIDAGFTVGAVTLPDGARIVITG